MTATTAPDAVTATIIRHVAIAVDDYVLHMAGGRSLKDLYEESIDLAGLEEANPVAYELVGTALDHVDWGHVAEETIEAYMDRQDRTTAQRAQIGQSGGNTE